MNKLIQRRGFKYLASFFILFFILTSMTVRPIMTNMLGEEILIKIKPLDPRDLFRGDYVQLNYEINDIDSEKLDKEILKLKGENEYYPFEALKENKLYVSLKKNVKSYEVDKVTLKKPKEGVFLKGKYEYSLWHNNKKDKLDGIRVKYTLDKYFVPENTGEELEEKARKGEVFAKIKVYKGYSYLKEIVD
ncbi:GDYXXLXY domain-containing protein [Clostridium aestuarii]|uniref:GDYXXLXY domain-containing protein n=1 Tax=Clostridium aestuarii TaxID=338193 RepID=A0ABT4CZ85_9CLOT|nr:GDYXXLXY domain-containing protein [Clostridium aestuarii]MCY6484137.1 GDYXXLXY domain-containing protein [Clostridium aestuarii]